MTCGSCGATLEARARFCPGCGAAVSTTEPASQEHSVVGNMAGREIAGRYRILEKIGEGGMGAVFRAEQMSLKRKVALKLLRPDLSTDPGLVRRFNAEAELAAKLNHPNTVTLFDFGQDEDGSLFIAMEFVEGQSLRGVMLESGALKPGRALAICQQVCSSLADAHSAGIVHRDLKPDNVMLTSRGTETDIVRVLDFGIAKLRDERSDGTSVPMTQQGDLLGTPQYMAPEQIRAEPVDGRTDVYALGAMLYEMVTGRLPFEGPTVMAILSKHLTELPQPPMDRRRDLGISPQLNNLVMECLQKDPAARPPSMEALGTRIKQLKILHGSATPIASARPDSMPIKRFQSRPPGVRWTPSENVAPVPRAPTPAPPYGTPQPQHGTPPPAAITPAPTPPHVGQLAPPQKSGKGWLWAVAAILLVGGGATAAVLLAQKDVDDETSVAASDAPDIDDSDDTGFRSDIGGDFSTNPQRKLFELDDSLEGMQDSLERLRDTLKPGFGSNSGDGVRYVDPKFGYVLELPAGMPAPEETGDDAVVSAGMVGDTFTAIAAVGIPTDKPLPYDELKIAAQSFAGGLGGEAIEIKSYRVLGQRTWGGIYEKDDFRLEAIFYPADGYVLAVSIGTQTRDFKGSEAFRRNFFDNRVRLK